MEKSNDWWSGSDFYDDSEHRKEFQEKRKVAVQKKKLMAKGNGTVNVSSIHARALADKVISTKENKNAVLHPKKESNDFEEYSSPPVGKSDIQRNVADIAGYINLKRSMDGMDRQADPAKEAESIYLTRGTPEKIIKDASAYTLADYSDNLLSATELICVDKHLFRYNGICHESCDVDELLVFYREHIDRKVHGAKNLRIFSELHKFLLADSRLRVDESGMAPAEYCFLINGIFDVKKQRLIKHTSNLIAFSFVNARYVENPVCKKFDRFLEITMQGDKTLIRRFWYMLAYIFMQSLDAKTFFALGTAPNSGKSLLGKLIQQLYLKKYVSAIALNDMNKDFSLAPIVGAAVNLNMDLPNSRLNSAAVSSIKLLTGGDLMNINQKFVPQFKYQNRAKLLFGTNYPIKLAAGIAGDDEKAFWDRMVFIPFMYSVPKDKQNPKLLEELLVEKDAIVSKALRYGRDLLEESYVFPSTLEIDRIVAEWKGDDQYFIDCFLSECCEMTDAGARETMDNLYRAYCRFCDANGENMQSWSMLKSYIERRGVMHLKARLDNAANPKSAFEGIKLSTYGRRLLDTDVD